MKDVVLFSGGLDSTLCLIQAIAAHKMRGQAVGEPCALTMFYGQEHEYEVTCARHICKKLGVTHHVIDLTKAMSVEVKPGAIVQGRNAMFLATAAHWCTTRYDSIVHPFRLWVGACQEDQADFPDCRPDFFEAMQTVFEASDMPIEVVTPAIASPKSITIDQTYALAAECGIDRDVCEQALGMSWSCYNPQEELIHTKRYPYELMPPGPTPCDECYACYFRKQAFDRSSHADPSYLCHWGKFQ